MVRPGLVHLLVVLVVGVLGVSCAVQEDADFPNLLPALGSKLALADDYYDDDSGTGDAEVLAAPCCFPLVWQGRSVHELALSSHGRAGGRGRRSRGGPVLSRSIDQFYVDGSHQRLAGHKLEFRKHEGKFAVNISWIFNIGANRTGNLYFFDEAAKKCQHRTLRNASWRRQCIPSNATMHGTFSLGPVGGLNVQSWSFGGRKRSAPAIDGDNHPYPKPRVVFGANILVVPTTCVPVLIREHGFVFRGIDQQQDELSRQVDIDDTGSLDGDDSDYASYVRYAFLFYSHFDAQIVYDYNYNNSILRWYT